MVKKTKSRKKKTSAKTVKAAQAENIPKVSEKGGDPRFLDLGVVEKKVDPNLLVVGIVAFVAIIGIIVMVSSTVNNYSTNFNDLFSEDASNTIGVAIRAKGNLTAPNVSLLRPYSGQEFYSGYMIEVELVTADDGFIRRVDIWDNNLLLGYAVKFYAGEGYDRWSYDWNGAIVGEHDLYAKAIDNDGNVGISNYVSITVVRDLEQEEYDY